MGKRRNSSEPPLAIELPVVRVQPPVRRDGRPEAFAYPDDAFPLAGVRRVVAMEGPLPLPETLAEYDAMMPGLAARIVDWAEREAEHRRAVERSLLRMAWGGLWCALLVFVAGRRRMPLAADEAARPARRQPLDAAA